jgi:hypothetical protein
MLAWHIFGKSYATRGGAMIRTIQRIQRRAAQIIPGGFRTTAGAAVDVGFHLPPVQLQLEQNAVEATMGIRTTPLYDDMASTEAGRDEPGRPLQRRSEQSAFDRLSRILETKHGVRLELLEKRIPHVVPPWWTPPFTHINESAEEAVKGHDTRNTTHLHRWELHQRPRRSGCCNTRTAG